MTKAKELWAKADKFAARAAAAKARTERNTYLSLEQSCRTLAAHAEQGAAERAQAANAR